MPTKVGPGHLLREAKPTTAGSTGKTAEPPPAGTTTDYRVEQKSVNGSPAAPDELRPPGALRVEGYQTCVCGAQVLDQLYYLTAGVCLECFLNGTGRYLREIELRHEARQRSIKLKTTVKRGTKKTKTTTKNGKLAEKAKRAALRRLKSWVPDLWDIAYTIERSARGLPPLPLRRPPGHFVEAVATAARNSTYAAADPGGVIGAQDEDPSTER